MTKSDDTPQKVDTPIPTPTPTPTEAQSSRPKMVEISLPPFARFYKMGKDQAEQNCLEWVALCTQLEEREHVYLKEIARLNVEVKIARGEKVPQVSVPNAAASELATKPN